MFFWFFNSKLTNSVFFCSDANDYFGFLYSSFAGKTVFVTGGSRGIGKAIALKMAKDGCNVVIAAKTTDPHPKLEGTIYTAAKESECFLFVLTNQNEFLISMF